MATPEDTQEASGNGSLQVAMDDIMDVITLYKCKFCQFSCGQPADIRQHVQDVHVVQEVKQVELKENTPDTSGLEVISLETHDAPKHVLIEPMDEEMHPVPEEHEVHAPMEQEPMQENSSLITDEDVGGTTQEQALQTVIVEDEYEKVSVESGTQCVDLAPTSGAGPQIDFSNRDLTELYLCGQCNFGFDSIESCRSHIIKDHNVAFEDDNEEYDEDGHAIHHVAPAEEEEEREPGLERVSAYPEKISVGTQVMSRKKPGRKRKVREEPTEENPPIEEVYEEEEAAVIEEHRLHQQEEEELDNADMEDDGRLRRRRKLPSRLTQLYYVGKPTTTRRAPPPEKKIKTVPFKKTCPKGFCSARFRTTESVDIHLACHKVLVDQGQARESFGCIKCEYFTEQWKVMRMHLWREHNVDTDLFSCETCDFKSDTLGRVERHAQIHGEARPYICNECGKGFKQLTQLHNHKMTHMGKSADPDKWYSNKQCEICHRTFANQKCLKNHIEIVHSKEKPFVCPYCNHATSRKAILDLHIRTHTGEKPFKCDMCAYVTGDHNSLRRHRMRHTGEKPYKCKYCKYSAIQAISLKTHMRNKHPGCEGVFACESCPYRTVNEQHFNNHLQDHKNGLISNVQTVKKPSNVNNKVIVSSPRSLMGKTLLPTLTTAPRQILTINGQPISAIQIPTGTEVQAPQPAEVDPNQANSMLLSKVANLSMVQGDMNTARIIYTALGALSNKGLLGVQGPQEGEQQGVDVAGQPTVQSATQDGVTTHTITFHIPPQGEGGEGDKQQAIQVENFSQVAASAEGHAVNTQASHVGGATIEEGQVLLALQAQGGAANQEPLSMEGAEVVYTTTTEVPQHVSENIQPENVPHLVCEAQETITMEVTQGEPGQVIQTPTTSSGTREAVPIDLSETTVVEVAPTTEALTVQGQQEEEPVVMNLIGKDNVMGDGHVQYITIS